jgi:hypothetical protein
MKALERGKEGERGKRGKRGRRRGRRDRRVNGGAKSNNEREHPFASPPYTQCISAVHLFGNERR